MSNRFNISSSSFVCGAPTSNDGGWVVAAIDELGQQEIEHSAILRLQDGEFLSVCLKMFRSKHAAWLPQSRLAVFVGDDGQCCVIDENLAEKDEYVSNSPRNPRSVGHIRAATRIDEEVIAVGMQRQVYRRTLSGKWIDMMQGLPTQRGDPTTGFECVIALAEDEIYAAGWHGEIWIFDGHRWAQIDSPTNRIITSLSLTADGQEIIGCGQRGVILQGRRDSWRLVDTGGIPDDLWSIATFERDVYVAALQRIYAWNGAQVDLVEVSGARSFGLLLPGDGFLWSMGQKDLVLLDGKGWRTLSTI